MDAATCWRVQAAMDAGDAAPAEVLASAIMVEDEIRLADEIEVAPAVLVAVEDAFDSQRPAISAYYDLPLTGREGAGFLRYPSGGYYRPHRDRADLTSWPHASRREIAAVLFLNSAREAAPDGEFSGGALRLFPEDEDDEPLVIAPQRGLLVAFPATLLHEVTLVLGGRRDTVVDWFY
jgi:predicted 2-oxoglutarate/Fe(II)-dependent dioxygenase YbiX